MPIWGLTTFPRSSIIILEALITVIMTEIEFQTSLQGTLEIMMNLIGNQRRATYLSIRKNKML